LALFPYHPAVSVLYTQYADTALYIGNLARRDDWAAEVITSSNRPSTPSQVNERVRTTGGPLIITDAGAEAFNLTGLSVSNVIHYDLPRQPERIAERILRFNYLGAGEEVVHQWVLDGILLTERFANLLLEEINTYLQLETPIE
jgi:hypothetical protein